MNEVIYKQSEDVVVRQEGEESILFNPDNSDIIVINSMGCFIWNLCDGKNSTKDIVAQVMKNYNATEEKVTADLSVFLEELEKRKFVVKE